MYISPCYMFCKDSFKTVGIDKDFLGHCTLSLLLPASPRASYTNTLTSILKTVAVFLLLTLPYKKVAESSSSNG